MVEPDEVPRLARPFVVVLIGLMLASAVFLWEPWPVTSFRLFSHLRYDEQAAWEATALTPNGRELAYPIAGAPRGLRGFGFVMAEFVDADAERRSELCRVWVGEAPDVVGRPVAEVQLYQRRWRLSDRASGRALPGSREHEFTCSDQGFAVVR